MTRPQFTSTALAALLVFAAGPAAAWADVVLPAATRASLTVRREADGRISLVGPDCASLEAQRLVLRTWTRGLGEGLSSAAAIPASEASGCALDVTGDLPRFVREHHGQHPTHDGPNCWNTSLVLTRLTPSLRYANPEEMSFWMGSPLCRELGVGEARRTGDVVAIRRPGWDASRVGEEHGFIYLSDEISFSKNGYWNGTAFELQPTAGVFAEYGMEGAAPACLSAVGQPSGCDVWANTYRCRSLEEFLADKTATPPARFLGAHADLNRTECLVEHWAVDGTEPTDFRQVILDSLAAIDQLANQELAAVEARTPPPERERFLWRSLLVRSASLREQLDL